MKKKTKVEVITYFYSMLAGLVTVHDISLRFISNVAYQPYPASQSVVGIAAILFFISTLYVFCAFFSFIEVCMHKRDLEQFTGILLKAVKYSVVTLIILWVLMHTQVVSSPQGIEIAFSSSQKTGAPGFLMTWGGIKMSLWGMGAMWLFFLVGVILDALLDEEPESTEPKSISYEDCKH